MMGSDYVRIAQRAIRLALAERRLRDVSSEGQRMLPRDDAEHALWRARHKSAALSVAGYRNGLRDDIDRVLSTGISGVRLPPLAFEIERGDVPLPFED